MMHNPDLYKAILARHSVRRYEKGPLDAETLEAVQGAVDRAHPLIPTNRYASKLCHLPEDGNLAATVGAYGRLLGPPHVLVSYSVGPEQVLTDLGFRMEQIAVRLVAMELATCFVGTLKAEETVCARFTLPAGARTGALLAIGRPATSLGGRATNALIHSTVGAGRRIPLERLFFKDHFHLPGRPPQELLALFEAARWAPSAVNAQPWRFLWRDGRLSLFVKRRNRRYGGAAREEYALYDGGICMANLSLALEAMGRDAPWAMYVEGLADVPEHPPGLRPLAWIDLA